MEGYTRVVRVHDSSQIKEVAYDVKNEVLRVEFSNGDAYRYNKVDAQQFASLVSSASVGKFFASYIRPFYKGEKL